MDGGMGSHFPRSGRENPLSSIYNGSPKGQLSFESLSLSSSFTVSGVQSSGSFVSRKEISLAVSGLCNQLSEVLTDLEYLRREHGRSPSPPTFLQGGEVSEKHPLNKKEEAIKDLQSFLDESSQEDSQSLGLSQIQWAFLDDAMCTNLKLPLWECCSFKDTKKMRLCQVIRCPTWQALNLHAPPKQ